MQVGVFDFEVQHVGGATWQMCITEVPGRSGTLPTGGVMNPTNAQELLALARDIEAKVSGTTGTLEG